MESKPDKSTPSKLKKAAKKLKEEKILPREELFDEIIKKVVKRTKKSD